MIYILLGPILLLTGTILIFYTFIHYQKNSDEGKMPNINVKQKKNHIIECEKCNKKLRVPTVSEVLNVTCPSCKHKFTHG